MPPRLPQPPISPSTRDTERRDFWAGFIASLIGLLVLVCGALHVTGIDTTEGNSAWETQLIKSFTSGGLEYSTPAGVAEPAEARNPEAEARALPQMEQRNAKASRLKYRVHIGARTPCPT